MSKPSIDLSKPPKKPLILEGHFTSNTEPIIAEGKIIDVEFFGVRFKAKVIKIKFKYGVWTATVERL